MDFYERFFAQHNTFVLKIAIFFIYLLIIYPACPARDEKSDDPPARVVAFSFVHDCPFGWDEPECPLSIFSEKNILTQNRALPGGNALRCCTHYARWNRSISTTMARP